MEAWEVWEWEADTDMVVDGVDILAVAMAMVQDSGVAELDLAREVDEEVDAVEGITMSCVRHLA